MLRSSLIAAGAAVLCSSSFAQRTLDASKVYPITSPIQNAGVFNVNTQRWMSPSRLQAQQGVVQSIFDNTCSWTGGAYYTGTGSCETYIDEGIVPGPGNLDFAAIGGTGAVATNNVVLIQFGYCTNFAVPLLTIGFYDTLGGQCGGFATNGIAPTGGGQPTLQQQAAVAGVAPGGINPSGKAYYDFGAAPGSIPGDTTPGGTGVSCWITGVFLGNTGFCLQSDADGTWDNDPDLDRFNWSFEMDNVFTANPPDGVILAGEPLAAPGYGACSYNIACAADPLTGAACGTGFGQDDGFWINVDKDGTTTPNTGVACFSAPTAGTGCYWFGGHPAGIFGGFWMVMVADGECGTTIPSVSNCQTAPTTNQSCNSVVSTVGLPSASSNSTFTVTFGSLNQGTTGVVFYGTNGPIANTWSNHSLICVKSPTVRLGGVPGASGNTGGVGACNGQYSFNANAVIQNAAIAAGTRVDMQAWVRDSSNPKTTYQSDAVNFVVGP